MAAPINANINILVNTKQATAQIRALQAEINNFNKNVVAANSAAARQQAALNKALMDSATASGMFNAKIVPTTAGIDRFSQALDKGKLSLNEYARGAASQLPGMRRIFTREFDMITRVAEDRLKKLQTQYTQLGNSQKALALQPTALDMGNMATQTAMAAQKQMIFNKMINDGSTKLLNWGKNTQWAGRQLMVGFTLPLTMFGTVASKIFMDLDKQARDFKRVYGDIFTPPSEIQANLEAVQALGQEYTKYGVAVSDVMQVAATAAAAGMRNDKLIAGTEESLRLATIGQIDYNQALDTTISLQTAFKMSAEDLAPSVDFLGAVANQTVLTIDDMTKAIPRVAPVVQGLGGDVKDLAAMLVAMREGGVSAENAANGLKSGLASLINPTNRAKEKLGELGINIEKIVQANKGDLMGTVMDFGTALSRLGDFERQQALEKTFGKYQYARLGALFDNIIKKGGQAEVALTLAGQSAEELGQLSEKSLKEIEQSTTAKFTGAVERLKVAIAPVGEAFLKALTPVIEFITKIADKFNSLPDGIKNAIAIVTAVIAGIGPVILMLVGLVANGAANIIKFIQAMRKGFAKIRGDASAFEYLASAELDAAAAAASLEGKTTKLTSALLLQKRAVSTLTGLYERLAASAATAAAAMPTTMGGPVVRGRGGKQAPQLKMAKGGVVPGSGRGDKIPALLEPGESVVTKKASQRYAPIIAAMNAGTLPGYQGGLNLPGVRIPDALSFAQGKKTTQAMGDFFESIKDLDGAAKKASEILKGFADRGEKVTNSKFMKAMSEAGYNLPSGSFEAAHLTKFSEGRLSAKGKEMLQSMPGKGGVGQSVTAQKLLTALQEQPALEKFIREYSGLTANLPKQMNKSLLAVIGSGRGVQSSEFLKEFDKGGKTLGASLEKFGGFVASTAEETEALATFEKELGKRIKARADKTNEGLVVDSILVDETQKFIKEKKRAGGALGKVAVAAENAQKAVAQVALDLSSVEGREFIKQNPDMFIQEKSTGKDGKQRTNIYYAETGPDGKKTKGAYVARYSEEGGKQRWKPSERVGRLARGAGGMLGRQSVTGARVEVGAASPAEKFAEVMDDAAKGMMVGAKRSSKIAAKSGGTLAQSARDAYKTEMSQLRRDIRNVGVMQAGGMTDPTMQTRTLRRLEESKARARQSELREAQRATQLAQRNAKLAAQTTTAMQQQSAAMGQQAGSKGFFGKVVGVDAEGNPITRGQKMRNRFMGRGSTGVGMGVMSAALMAPMLPGAAGDVGSKIQPALMGLSTLQMLGPMLTNPAGLVVTALLASAGAMAFFKIKADEMAKNAEKFSNALVSGRKTTNQIAEFYGTESLARKSDIKEMKAVAGEGTKTADITKAEEFLKSDVGNSMKEGLSQALQTMGTSAASKQFATNLSSMVLQGVVNPEQAKAIASVMSKELGNKTFGIQAVASLNEVIGPNGEKLSRDPLQIALDIDQRNVAFLDSMKVSMDELSLSYQSFFEPKIGDLVAFINPIYGVINAINKATLGWDNWFGDISRSARGILNTDNFEEQQQKILEIGSSVGNQLAQSYDNLNAAKERYARITAEAAAIDEKDVNAKAEAKAAAERAKQQMDLLTNSISNQKRAIVDFIPLQTELIETTKTVPVTITDPRYQPPTLDRFSRGLPRPVEQRTVQVPGPTINRQVLGEAGREILDGMEQSLQSAYAENPMQKAALDMITGNLKGLNPKLRITMMTEFASMQLDPLTFQNLMDLYDNKASTASSIYLRIVAQLEGDSAAATQFLQSLMQGGFSKETTQRLRVESSGMSADELKMFTGTLQQISLIDNAQLRKQIAFSSTGLTVEQLERQNKGLEILNGLPSEIRKTVMIATNAQSALKVGRWYQNFQKFPNITKEIFLNDSQYYTALQNAQISYEQFSALPDIQKSVVMTYIQQYESLGTMDFEERRARKAALEAAIAAARAEPIKSPGAGDGTPEEKDGGGEKEKTALQKVQQSISERLRLYTNFPELMKKYKGSKDAFEKSIEEATMGSGIVDKLRKFNLNESLIADIISQGAQGAQKILNALNKRKGLAEKMNMKDILGRAGEQMSLIVSSGNQAMAQATAATSARAMGASSEVAKQISDNYELAVKFNKIPPVQKKRMILEIQTSTDAQKTLELAQDPTKMLRDETDTLRKRQSIATKSNRDRIAGLQRELELVNRQISAIEELNNQDRLAIRNLERKKEMIQRQIDALERQNEMDQRRIDTLRREDEIRNRVAEAINRDLEIMSQQEDSIRDGYQKRIDALNKVSQINEQISNQQKEQLGLAQALSQGDIYAAAAAAQQMQASQGQFAAQQQTEALQQGMENQVAGLTTPGGLTRSQAEEQVRAIKEQSYQVGLQIRDIEDQIYNRNLLIVPLKDQQYQIDLQIRDLNDAMFNRETEILGIQNSQAKALQSQITAEQDVLDAKNLQFETRIGELDLAITANELSDTSIKNVNSLASAWHEVTKQIARANEVLKRQLENAGKAPDKADFKGADQKYKAAVAAYNAMLEGFKKEHEAAVTNAMNRGKEALAGTAMNAGGYVKKYAAGKYVMGNGSRDSVPAMLTPGEFVIRKAMVDKYGLPTFNKMNMGSLPKFNVPGGENVPTADIQRQAVNVFAPRYGDTGYNSYSVNVNVPNTNASPDAIANRVAMKIQDINRRGIGNSNAYKQ